VALFAGESVLVFARSLMPRLGEMLVAASTSATVRNQNALPGHRQIRDGLTALVVENERANGNPKNHVFAGVAGAVGAFAVATAIGLEFAIVTVAEEGVVVQIGFHIDAAAMAAVAAGRTTPRHIFLAAECAAPIAAVAGLYEYFGFINKH
jgi:hypothetical protein